MTQYLHTANICAALACMASFAWGAWRFFRRTIAHQTRMPPPIVVGYVTSLCQLTVIALAGSHHPANSSIALILYAISFALFWLAIAANRQRPLRFFFATEMPGHIVTHGPYRIVRHHFYSSYLLCWIAGTFASSQAFLWVTVLIAWFLYRAAAIHEERQFLVSDFSRSYHAYACNTGRFFPYIGRLTEASRES